MTSRQDRLLQRAERPVRDGRDRVRQHADAVGRLHQDDREGAGCRRTLGELTEHLRHEMELQ